MNIENMTIKERIQKFIQKHPDIDQSLTPELWVTWKGTCNGKDYRKMYNTTTGDVIEFSDPNDAPDWVSIIKVSSKSTWNRAKPLDLSYSTFHGPNPTNKQGSGKGFTRYNNRVLLSAGSNSDMVYFKYDEKLKVMEMSLVYKDTKRYNTKLSKKENIRKWERVPKAMHVFLVDGNKDLYDANGQIMTNGYYFEDRWPLTFKTFCSKLGSSNIMYKCGTEFEKFAKDNLYGSGGIPLDPTYGWHLEHWLTYRPKVSKTGAVSKKINELCSYKLVDIPEEELLKIGSVPDIIGYWYERGHNRVYVDVDSIPDWAVLRIFYYHDNKNQKFHEGFRIFIGNDGDIKLAKRVKENEWTYSHDATQSYGHQFAILNPQDIPKHKRLSYIYEIVSLRPSNTNSTLADIPGKRLLSRIIRLMKAPEIEMLYKAGYKNTALVCLDDHNAPNTLFTDWFGTINRKKKDLAAKFGINKKQLEIFNSYFDPVRLKKEQHCNVISKIKGTLEVDDISAMDVATFNKMFSLVLQWKDSGGSNRKGDDSNSILTPEYSMPDELGWSKEKQLRYMMKIAKITKNWTEDPLSKYIETSYPCIKRFQRKCVLFINLTIFLRFQNFIKCMMIVHASIIWSKIRFKVCVMLKRIRCLLSLILNELLCLNMKTKLIRFLFPKSLVRL